LLLALLHADPANKSIEPLVHIINARLGAGDYRWDGDVAIASMALTKYCDTQTKTAAAGSTSVSAGTKEAIKYTFVNGRSQIGTTTLNMPTSAAAIIVNDTGTAAFTHAVTASLTPISLADSAQKTAGFTVLRRYEASDHADHVWQDSEGIWHAKAGSDLKAVITFVPDKFITRAILKDNFPAGLTPYWNKLPQQENYHRPINDQWSLNWDYSNLWPQATDHECNSVQAYGSNLPTNEYHFSYKLRASTPGTFVVAPAEIVCPYDNNCFGRSAGDRFIVEQ
jgi:uncharacterized protein YfaS (alpha-2-macroglobulin family)